MSNFVEENLAVMEARARETGSPARRGYLSVCVEGGAIAYRREAKIISRDTAIALLGSSLRGSATVNGNENGWTP